MAELSTGSRRIVELACQIGVAPTVVLLDEPSAGIAQRETEALAGLLRRVREVTGASLLLIEHDLALCLRSPTAGRPRPGRVITEGPPDAALRDHDLVTAHTSARAKYPGESRRPPGNRGGVPVV